MKCKLTEVTTLWYGFRWFFIQTRNILQWTVVSTVRYTKCDNWMMETAYSKLNVGNFVKLHNMILTQQQRIVSKGAMNSFKKMFPLAVMHAHCG